MASSITTAVTVPSSPTAIIEAKHRPALSSLEQRAADLAKRPLTAMTAALAVELDTEAKLLIEAVDRETKPWLSQLYNAHRGATAFCNKFKDGAMKARERARGIIGSYNLEQRRLAAEKKIADDRAALAQAEAAKKAEIDARLQEAAAYEERDPQMAQFILQEAQDMEQQPAVPVIMPALAPAKVEGTSTRYELAADVTDVPALLAWIIDGKRWDIFGELYDLREAGLKAVLKRGLRPSGVANYREVPIVSNRMRG